MALEVRAALAGDAALIARLNRPVQALHARWAPGCFRQDTDPAEASAYFAGYLASEGYEFGIAERQGDPLGYAWIELSQRAATPFTLPSRVLVLNHICVAEPARRQGVGSALMTWAQERAEALRADTLVLDHWSANEAAHLFFKHNGFEPRRMVMVRPLGKH